MGGCLRTHTWLFFRAIGAYLLDPVRLGSEQAYFEYDAKKSGGVTISHLRFGPKPIHAPCFGLICFLSLKVNILRGRVGKKHCRQ